MTLYPRSFSLVTIINMLNSSGTDIFQAARTWIARIPALSKCVMYLSVLGCILSFVFPTLCMNLINIPLFTLMKLQLYRIFTTPFLSLGILQVFYTQVLFSLISYMPTACRTERRLGTMSYLWFFSVNSNIHLDLIVQVLFIGLMYIITYIPGTPWPAGNLNPCVGLWPLIMIEIVVRCNLNPEEPMG